MTRRGLLLFIAMSVIWGVSYLFIRIAVKELSPAVLVFSRCAISAAILLPIVLARGELRGLRKSWLPLLVFAAVEIGIPWFMLSSAEQTITSSLAGLLIAAVPLVSVVIATGLGDRDHLGLASISGLLLGLVGVAGPGRDGGCRRVLLAGPGRHLPLPGRPPIDGRDGGRSRGWRPRLRAAGRIAVAALGSACGGHRIGAGAGRRLHGDRLRVLLRIDRRDRPGAGDSIHVHQPGGRRGSWSDRPTRELHRRDGDRFRPRACWVG